MSIESTLQGYREAWTAGDLERIVAAYHDDFVLHYFGESPLAGTHAGKEAALTIWIGTVGTSTHATSVRQWRPKIFSATSRISPNASGRSPGLPPIARARYPLGGSRRVVSSRRPWPGG
jgi:hypothetical protein